MSSIPLVALGVQQPHIENPQDFALATARLRALGSQDQLQQQQVQGAELENQQRQQALKDQAAQTAALQQWDHKNPDDLPGLIVKNGGSASASMQMQQALLGIRQKTADMLKTGAEANLTNWLKFTPTPF